MKVRIAPEDIAELKAFRPIAAMVVAVWALGTLARNYFFPDHLNLTDAQQYLLLALEAAALLAAHSTHLDNKREGIYQQ
ncbi:hypothetical protein AB0K18_42915 [Nonomuraea sp. NPDC049421]|uniref:hypothetical protein n=1 Tax=Nonomuraea sp. NPDC049421 TaxID=3155275 RepID=UPI0034348F19